MEEGDFVYLREGSNTRLLTILAVHSDSVTCTYRDKSGGLVGFSAQFDEIIPAVEHESLHEPVMA